MYINVLFKFLFFIFLINTLMIQDKKSLQIYRNHLIQNVFDLVPNKNILEMHELMKN